MVSEELRVLDTLLENLQRSQKVRPKVDYEESLKELRASLEDEKLHEDISSVMEQIDRMTAMMRQDQKHEEGEVDLASPYFGRLVLEDDFGKRTVLIGKSTFLSDRVRIVDWRNAPISRLFYQYVEGDDYDETVNGRDISGEILVRRMCTIIGGQLQRISNIDESWAKRPDGTWRDMREHEAQLSGGQQKAIRPDSFGTGHASSSHDKYLPEIASLLDPEQFKLITAKDSGVVAIQGSAGSGKTTVALHRIAWLVFHNPKHFRAHRIAIFVFSKALSSYISKVLPALGVKGTLVFEYDSFASRMKKQHFPDLPSKYSHHTPAIVVRFKSHPAMLSIIADMKHSYRGENLIDWFDEHFTDLPWIKAQMERYAKDAFSDDELTQIHRWCVEQAFLREDADDASPDQPPCLDLEDNSLFLRMHQILLGPLRGPNKKPLQFDHLMVDEAQDLSPVELAVLIDCTSKRKSVTLAGDVAQKVRENRDFSDWTTVLDALSLSHIHISPLQVSYRATRQIMEVSRYILGHLAPDEALIAPRSGAPVGHLRFGSLGEAATWLGPALSQLMTREPLASVAVLCLNPSRAREWFQILDRSHVPALSLVSQHDFSFAPGIEVTDIRSSKGLEFDYVVLCDVDESSYPARDEYRHLLHVGATRAAHQLWLVSTGTPSPLIPPGLPGLDGPS